MNWLPPPYGGGLNSFHNAKVRDFFLPRAARSPPDAVRGPGRARVPPPAEHGRPPDRQGG
jgi:hypothetical protein